MTTAESVTPEFTGIDDLTLAEVDARLKEHQQLVQFLLQTPGSLLSCVTAETGSVSPEQQVDPRDEQLFLQAVELSERQELHQAARFYCRAAYAGHLQAQLQLGHCYLKGSGVPKSAVFAYSWFLLAALQQEPTAEQACTVLCKHLTVQDQQQAHQLAAERFEKITLQNNK